tara:strand:+ start:2028 stop:2753 length:726 start_codon:yes stop_codon:yes gene_type:complete
MSNKISLIYKLILTLLIFTPGLYSVKADNQNNYFNINPDQYSKPSKSKSAQELNDEAFELFNKELYDEALFLLNQSIQKESPKINYLSLEFRANLLNELKRYNESLQDYNLIIQANEGNSHTMLARGKLKQKLNDYEGAKKDYQEIISGESGKYSHAYTLGPAYQSLALLEWIVFKQYEKALIAIRNAKDYTYPSTNRNVEFETHILIALDRRSEACANLKILTAQKYEPINPFKDINCSE